MTEVGVRGVRLKQFERIVASVLPHVDVTYSQLPPVPADASKDWPFDVLPDRARVYGDLPGQLSNQQRAKRKEEQLRSMLRCILAFSNCTEEQPTIVDFGGGTGHLAIPLALLKPEATVIVVDLHFQSLDLLHSKANECMVEYSSQKLRKEPAAHEKLKQCDIIPNLYTFYGPLQDFDGYDFDIGVALHLCGEATDVALRQCGRRKATAVFAPCCVGKLNASVKNPYIWQSTGSNEATVTYPQSSLFGECIVDKGDWNALAKAADYSDMPEARTSRNAARRTAKALLETDRRLFMEQNFGYQTLLTRMEPWEATPKNDILLAWSSDSVKPSFLVLPNQECQADIQRTIEHLCQPLDTPNDGQGSSTVDWTAAEEDEVRCMLQAFVESGDKRYVFATGMGSRKRKLVHYVAGKMSLGHWSQGKKYADKTVIVERTAALDALK